MENEKAKIFSVYSDESGCFSERYQAIALVSGERNILPQLSDILHDIVIKAKITELKFSELRTHYPKLRAAYQFIERGVEFARQNKIRVDILLWDIQDKRHSIQRRDNIANLELMYYKVLRHISERWHQINWELYPDENSQINWDGIISYLNETKMPRIESGILSLFKQERYNINFVKVLPSDSENESLIQLADLFAGIACFIREYGGECIRWFRMQNKNVQYNLIENSEEEEIEKGNRTKYNRFKLVGFLDELCKQYKLGVSFKTKKYFNTFSPNYPINFWNYEPQHDDDKAPTR
jgi:hypothetical protein